MRVRPDRSGICPGCGTGRGHCIDDDQLESAIPLPKGEAGALRFRARLFQSSRQPGVRPDRQHQPRLLGINLAREHPVDADVVVPVPDSGVSAAIGYSAGKRHPARIRADPQPLRGRTFIEPRQSIRNFGVKVKLNPVREILRGKRVVLGGRFDCARHHEQEDRANNPERRREGDPRAALPLRRLWGRATTASTLRRNAS